MNNTISFTSKVIVPFLPHQSYLVNKRWNKSTNNDYYLLPQIKKLKNNGDDNTIYLQGIRENNIQMTVLEYKDGKVYTDTMTRYDHPRINLIEMYSEIKDNFKNKSYTAISEKEFKDINPYIDCFV